jgi:hypothetical protein
MASKGMYQLMLTIIRWSWVALALDVSFQCSTVVARTTNKQINDNIYVILSLDSFTSTALVVWWHGRLLLYLLPLNDLVPRSLSIYLDCLLSLLLPLWMLIYLNITVYNITTNQFPFSTAFDDGWLTDAWTALLPGGLRVSIKNLWWAEMQEGVHTTFVIKTVDQS